MDKQFAYFLFGIQFLAAVSVVCGLTFFIGFSGGLDLIGYELPGLSATFYMLPIVFPLTVLSYVLAPKLKNKTIDSLLLLIVLISNVILSIQVIRVLRALVGWFV